MVIGETGHRFLTAPIPVVEAHNFVYGVVITQVLRMAVSCVLEMILIIYNHVT